jgi:transposase-like protein
LATLQFKSFQPEEAAAAFSPAALDEAWCREWILRSIHQEAGAKCPRCDKAIDEPLLASFYAGKRLVCKGCRSWFDARTGTVLTGTALTYPQIFCLAFLLAMGLPAKEIAARVGINQSTVYEWKNTLSLR